MAPIQTWQGDITTFSADAIVNAANSSLLGGGGVDGAIHRAAGPELVHECRLLGGCRTGEAKMTSAYRMTSATKIIHTVGPVYKGIGREAAEPLLASCYRTSLDLADAADLASIAFPSISTGIYGYPIAEASEVAVATIREWLAAHPTSSVETVTLVAFGAADLAALDAALG